MFYNGYIGIRILAPFWAHISSSQIDWGGMKTIFNQSLLYCLDVMLTGLICIVTKKPGSTKEYYFLRLEKWLLLPACIINFS